MSDGSVVIEVELTKEQIEKGLKSLNKDFNSLEKSTSGIASKLSKGLGAIGEGATKAGKALTVGLTTPLIALGTAGVKYNAQMEDFQANLTTLLGSADKAKDMLETLKQMANTTPFETSDLLEATQMMLGFGLQADKTTGYLQTLGDISMGNSEKLMSLTRAFSQIGAAGKATMEDINQMIDAGFNPLQIIAEQTGKSMADLRDEVSDGKISFEDIAKAMQVATSEGGRYYNAMEKASQTMNGKLSTAMDALKTALGSLTQSLLPVVTQVVEKITEWANAFANLDQETQQTILKILAVVAGLGPLLLIVGKVASGISSLIGIITSLKTAFIAGGAATKVLSSAFTALSGPAGVVITVITAVISIIVALYNKCENFRNTVNSAFEQIKNALMSAWTSIQPALQQLGQAFSSLLTALQPVGEFLVNVLGKAFSALGTILSTLITIITPVITFLINVITTIIPFISNAVASIINFFTVTIPNAFNSFINFWKQLGENIKNTFINAWNAIVSFFTETIPQWIQNVINWFKELPYNIGVLVGQVTAHIVQFGIDAWNWVTTELPKIINNIIDWFKQLPGNIWNWLKEAINNIIKWGTETWQKSNQAMMNFFNGVINWFKQLPGNIWNWLVQTIQKIGIWIVEMRNKANEGVSNIINSIINWFKELPGKIAEIGKNIIHGLWNGITGAGNWLKEKISNFASGIVDGFKSAFGIHSPSKVFNQEVGKFLALGLGEGFNDNINNVFKNMKSTVDFETQKLSANLSTQAVLESERNRPRTVNNDNGTTINNTQNFYEKNATPYEEQKQARQQLRRLAYGL